MKRRKFVTAGVFLAVLLAAALAAASIGSAATKSPKAASAKPGIKVYPSKMKPGRVGGATFAPVGAGKIAPLPKDKTQLNQLLRAAGKLSSYTGRALPGRRYAGNPKTGTSSAAAGSAAAPNTPINIPHIPSLPIVSRTYDAQKPGLNEYWQEATHGGVTDCALTLCPGGLTPPDQALAEGNGKVLEAVNNIFWVLDTNFNHPLAVEPTELLFAPALLATGYSMLSDPKALYDQATNRWFITEVAFDPSLGVPGSAVFVAVSNTGDPQGSYNIFVRDTSFDGTTCTGDGCLADQPLLGADRYGLFISTNSFDWDTGAFNGAQMYIIDKTALALGSPFPNVAYIDLGATFPTFDLINTCGSVNPGLANGYCWGSVQPATSPDVNFIADRGGTEFALSSADYLGSLDNRIADWAFTNTSSISGAGPIFVSAPVQVNTETYGFPLTNNCAVMPQMAFFGESVTQCGNAEQPASGNLPLCDTFMAEFFGILGGGCEPGQIATNDDRMNDVKSVKVGTVPATVWGAVNTDALISDPLGVLHRRSAIAWFSVSAHSWGGSAACPFLPNVFLCTAVVNGQGYVGNWQNDVVFPSIAVGSDGTSAAMVYSVTGNNTFPSLAVSKFNIHNGPGAIPIVLHGQDVLDDFCTDFPFCGTPPIDYRPRYGDYSYAVSNGNTVWAAGEYVQAPSCSDGQFLFDPSCGGTRGAFSNWGTGLVRLTLP